MERIRFLNDIWNTFIIYYETYLSKNANISAYCRVLSFSDDPCICPNLSSMCSNKPFFS